MARNQPPEFGQNWGKCRAYLKFYRSLDHLIDNFDMDLFWEVKKAQVVLKPTDISLAVSVL